LKRNKLKIARSNLKSIELPKVKAQYLFLKIYTKELKHIDNQAEIAPEDTNLERLKDYKKIAHSDQIWRGRSKLT
jgi:hypothetical protein